MQPDLLGPPYERQTIDLGRDAEGPVVATLVRRQAERPSDRAVLYLHGFVDYFFQAHLADFFVAHGWHFYALDLRKHGRSLLPHQTPNFCHDLTEYFPELDAAVRLIRERDRNRTLLLNGHSTGGLVAVLWAHARRDTGYVNGLFLNSPFFDPNLPGPIRRPVLDTMLRLARRTPYRTIPFGLSEVYGSSLHAAHRGEWSYNLDWKPLAGFPLRVGWLAAIRRGQRQLHAGLDIPVPVLIASSAASFRERVWHDSATAADAVLDVTHMARWAPKLGRHVTLVRIDGALHDLSLSARAVRQRVFTELARWVYAYVAPNDGSANAPASPSGPRHRNAVAEPGTDPTPAAGPPPGPLTKPDPGPDRVTVAPAGPAAPRVPGPTSPTRTPPAGTSTSRPATPAGPG